jgi:addiction module HigA family antidote
VAVQHCRFREQEREEFELFGPPHPGEILREEVLPRLRLSRKDLAGKLKISMSSVSRLLNGRRRLTRELAVRLARVSGTSPLYWLVLQAHHDAWVLDHAAGDDREAVGEFAPRRTRACVRKSFALELQV